jgi:CBS domain-containing protein
MATIREIMSTELVTVAPGSTVAEAATVMGGHKVGSALVMENDGLIGIFTERDILRALSQDFDAPTHQVAHWMTRDPVTVGPETSADEALQLMLDGNFRHLPVCEGSQPVGVVSLRDVSRAATEGHDGSGEST